MSPKFWCLENRQTNIFSKLKNFFFFGFRRIACTTHKRSNKFLRQWLAIFCSNWQGECGRERCRSLHVTHFSGALSQANIIFSVPSHENQFIMVQVGGGSHAFFIFFSIVRLNATENSMIKKSYCLHIGFINLVV